MRYKILRDPKLSEPDKPYFWIIDDKKDKLTAICNVMNAEEAKLVCGSLNIVDQNLMIVTDKNYEFLPEDYKMKKDGE